MQKIRYRIVAMAGIGLLAATAAHAHAPTLAGNTGTLVAGVFHPLLGWDHLLAAVAVGLLSCWQGGRAVRALPLAYVGAMAAGAAVAYSGLTLPFAGTGIALSLLLPGLLLAVAARPPRTAGLAMVASFALFHGYAHATALPQAAQSAGYVLGIAASTAALLALGVVVGRMARGASSRGWLRWTGGAIAAAGIFSWV